jgi:ParB family chromosome partitioning protein
MEKKTRLGRGLDALLGPEDASGQALAEVPVEVIDQNPYQPRKDFDDTELKALSDSIKTHGVLQPLVVRPVGGRYQLIAGERRLRAARSAGLTAVPVRLVDFNDQQVVEAALVENIQRSDLNPIEKAQGFKDYLDRFHMTHDQLAARLGLARSSITNLLSLLELPQEIQKMMMGRPPSVTLSHAKLLKSIPDPARQVAVARQIALRGLSVKETEALIQGNDGPQSTADSKSERAGGGGGGGGATVEKTAHVQGIEDELRQKLGVKVEVRLKAKDQGQVILSFETNDDFERLVEVLRR